MSNASLDKRISLYGKHVCTIDQATWVDFQKVKPIGPMTTWIKDLALKQYSINLVNSNELERLRQTLYSHHYKTVDDWIYENIRKTINDYNDLNAPLQEYIIYRELKNGEEIYLSKDYLTTEICGELILSWSDNINKAYVFKNYEAAKRLLVDTFSKNFNCHIKLKD